MNSENSKDYFSKQGPEIDINHLKVLFQFNLFRKDEAKQQKYKKIRVIFKKHYRTGYQYIGLYLLFSTGKYLACLYTLQHRIDDCEMNPLFVWLTIVSIYEFLNSIRQWLIKLTDLRYLTILHSLQTNCASIFLLVLSEFISKKLNISMGELSCKAQGSNMRTLLKQIIKEKLQEIDHNFENPDDPPFTYYDLIFQAEALNKYTKVMRVYNQFVYYMVFVGGNVAYLATETKDCDKHLKDLTFVLLLIGYLFSAFLIVGLGLAIVSMILYLPAVFLLFLTKAVWNFVISFKIKRKLKGLQSVTFNSVKHLNSEYYSQCYICMCDYKNGDGIMQLNCNQKHNFHDQCIEGWFKIKQQCPVCRKNQ